MSEFHVRRFEPGDEQGILDLFNSVFSEGNPAFEPRPLDVWSHIYLDNPAGHEILVATDADDKIIANYSAIPAFANVKGMKLRSAQAVDSCVAPAFRGSLRKNSVFVTIARTYCEMFGAAEEGQTNEYMWGLPNEKAFPVGTRIIGYKPVHCPMPRLYREPDEAWLESLRDVGAGIELRVSDGTDLGEMAALFERTVDENPLGVWKDEAYLTWRYMNWPTRPYRAVSAWRDDQMVGALVYRLGWMGQPLAPLVDWFGSGGDRAAIAAMTAHVAAETLAAGGKRLETWVTPGMSHHDTLLDLGLAREDSPFNLCIMVYSEHFDLEWAKANWAVTMGDSDIY